MRPSEALAKHRDQVATILSRYPVANARIFGSVARGEDTERSDLDILVDPACRLSLMHLVRLERELADLLDVKVGVHTIGDFADRSKQRVLSQTRSL